MAATASLRPGAVQAAPATPDQQILVMVRHPPDHYRPNGAYGGGYGDDLARSARERLARRIAQAHGLTLVDAWPMPMIGLDCFVMAVPAGRATAAAAAEVSRDSNVAMGASPSRRSKRQSAPASHNDPLYPAQPVARQWRLAELHELATGRGVKVAVIDSGIEGNHPDLAGQLLVNRNFVAGRAPASEQHGTGVAGIIAARADNGIGIAGVAPGARLLGLRACWQASARPVRTVCDSFSLAKALYFAAEQKADVINLSLERARRPLAGRAPQDRDGARLGGRDRVRSEAPQRRLPGVDAGRPGGLRHGSGTVPRPGLHCARARRSDHAAGGSMVSRQWQLLCRGPCQRSRRTASAGAPVGRLDLGFGARRRRADRRLRDPGSRGARL